ncbi:MAG: HNH endonuclease [Clostridium sp.]
MARLKSCVYCGRIHSTDVQCKRKPIKREQYKSSRGDLRNTYKWRKKREYIKHRDKYICQVCIRKEYFNPNGKYEFNHLEVHHIVPYKEDESKFYEDDNLVTLCKFHHEMAEDGEIPRNYLINIAKKNNL